LRLLINMTVRIMRKNVKYLLMLAILAVASILSTSCFRQDYLMFEDGEFDGIEFSDYDMMHNAEIELDDIDRD